MCTHEILESTLIIGNDQIEDGQSRQLIQTVVAEHVQIGGICMYVHSIVDISDWIP